MLALSLLVKYCLLLGVCLEVSFALVSAQTKLVYANDNVVKAATPQPTPYQSPLSGTPVNSNNSTNSEPNSPHGDVLVFWATIALVVVTALLVLVTFMLNRTTKEHVEHSRDLVETIGNILKIDRVARLTVSVVSTETKEPYISLQNIGRVPVMVCDLSIKFDSLSQTIDGARTMWILPLQASNIMHPILSDIWGQPKYDKVIIECSYYDVYYDETSHKERHNIKTEWTLDYTKRTITSNAGGNLQNVG